MAKDNFSETSSSGTRRFDKALVEDVNDFHLPENAWTQARNAITNSKSGDLGKLGNEPGNQFCTKAPYPIIGAVHLVADQWAIFSTDNTDSEIGLFKEEKCTYTKIVNDKCLNFNTANLIKGVSRYTSDCSYKVYWDDGINPSRVLDINNVPYIQICKDENDIDIATAPANYDPIGCITCTDTTALNCDKIRLAAIMTPPCYSISKGAGGGTLPNGMYIVTMAYTIDGQRISDYFALSNQLPLYAHTNIAGSVDINIGYTDPDFDEVEVVVIYVVAQQTIARKIGTYSTRQKRITIDIINPEWPVIPIENIPIRSTIYNQSDAMFSVNDYLIRVGPKSKFDFNYQPLANQIVTKWSAVEYPSDYYRNGGSNTGYMRDEVYSFFIRWVYDTGDKSASYHIPGRPAFPGEDAVVITDSLSDETTGPNPFNYKWVVQNTATQDLSFVPQQLEDGGWEVARGYMGYWESTEEYPDNKADVWNASAHPWSTITSNIPYSGTANGLADYDLCGEKVRHHKFPDNYINFTNGASNHFITNSPYYNGNGAIRVMGVVFENIKEPVDNDGNVIPGLIGYEILRGTRQGNRTVLFKGIINNMRVYNIEGGATNRTGLYANYPYNDLRPDPFLSNTQTRFDPCFLGLINGGETGYDPHVLYRQDIFSFHSADTNFNDPFLSGKELKVYSLLSGTAIGKFEYSEKHPEHKVISNTALIASFLLGLVKNSRRLNGEKTVSYSIPNYNGINQGGWIFGGPAGVGTGGTMNPADLALAGAALIAQSATYGAALIPNAAYNTGITNLAQNLFGVPGFDSTSNFINTLRIATALPQLGGFPMLSGEPLTIQLTEGLNSAMTGVTALPGFSTLQFFYNLTDNANIVLEFIKAFLAYRQYALKYNSHCFYNQSSPPPAAGNRRRSIIDQQYIGPALTDFGTSFRINNLYRSKFVALQVNQNITDPSIIDNTRQRASDIPALSDTDNLFNTPVLKEPTRSEFGTTSSCYYVGYKQRLRNQYGQINNIKQVPVSTCVERFKTGKNIPTSSVQFNGDVYIARLTEKNTFFFFYEWLFDQLDGYEFNYLEHRMVSFPRYWLNTREYEIQDFTAGLFQLIATLNINSASLTGILPSGRYNMDGATCNFSGIFQQLNFAIKYQYFYLFSSGIRDFYVESEINVAYRDYGELDTEKFYPIIGLKDIFNTQIIRSGNYFEYDSSFSISRNFINYISWGNCQDRNYDPTLAETCYVYDPNQLIYSLPANQESNRDNWLYFLANNYQKYLSRPTCVKPFDKNGSMVFFENMSPAVYRGVDQLQTTSGVSLTIGDGLLFGTPIQNLVASDRPYEYGSCQDRLSVITTPMGTFWISQNQGKIFTVQSGIEELSLKNLKWWFAQYLPYFLTDDFPDFELKENPYIGIGCQSIYDNENQILYFTKKDYQLRKDLPASTTIEYVEKNIFNILINGQVAGQTTLQNPAYFNDASWTISYDPKLESFVAYHDWHPDLLLPGKNTFMSIKNDNLNINFKNAIWLHNYRCDLYCNYYGIDYPFEVEWNVHTGGLVNSLRSIEYIMEVYKYADNCYDRFHVLDFNFDEAVVYNTEQCSGLLKLNLTPKNNAPLILQYPQITPTNIQILYSKEEQKYRFNQFWDVTASRGEFPLNAPYPPTTMVGTFAERTIWNTQPNGYIRVLNPNNLNYNKNQLERKKFRHYSNLVLLRRLVSGDKKMMVMIASNKNLYSPR